MIIFTVLLLILAALISISIFVLSIGGTLAIVIFGDLIVCIIFVVWLMKRRIRRKK
jgi:uncharacterized membrane protein